MIFHILVVFLVCSNSLFCIDTTPFYRVPFFQGEAKRNVSNWTTNLDVHYAQGSTDEAWNTEEVKTCLFNAHGPFDLTKLSANLENLDSTPKTKSYHLGDIPKLYDGKAIFSGHFDLEELNIAFQQNLLWGFYFQAYVPLRHFKICDIDYSLCSTTKTEQQKLINFIENDLDGILEEHCIEPLKTPFCSKELSDPVLSIGWHGHCSITKSILSALRGSIQGGLIVPTGSRQDSNRVFSLPFGYTKQWGVNVRGNIHATFWKKFVLGANAGTSVFFDQTFDQRLTTSTKQNGYIILEKGHANLEQGQVWDAGVYVKAERIIGGLSILAGYSFVQQEKSNLVLEDECVLETALKNGTIKNKNEVINTNKLLDQWYHHAVHAYAEYDFGAHSKTIAPTIRVSYDYPLLGKHAWPTDMWSGTLGLTLDWCW